MIKDSFFRKKLNKLIAHGYLLLMLVPALTVWKKRFKFGHILMVSAALRLF